MRFGKILNIFLLISPFFSCKENKSVERGKQEVEQGYIIGQLLPYLNLQLTNGKENMYIKTIKYDRANDCYRFQFLWNRFSDVARHDLSLALEVNIHDVRVEKNHQLVAPTATKDPATCWIYCHINQRDGEKKKNVIFTTPKDRSTVTLAVTEVKPDPITTIPIVSGTIKGSLYNPDDGQDSMVLDLAFKTRAY